MPVVLRRKGGDASAPAAEPEASKVLLRSRKPGGAGRRAVLNDLPEGLALSLELSEPATQIGDYLWIFYGAKKIGKTTFLRHWDDAYFLMCEPGGRGLRLHQSRVTTWRDFLGYVKLLKDHPEFRTIIVDTVDKLYDMCFDYMCTKLLIDHPSDVEDYGKSWGKIDREFQEGLMKLFALDRGFVFVSHDHEREIKPRIGPKYSYKEPTMARQASRFLTGLADVIGYYGYYGNERVLTIRGNDFLQAGCRLEENFVTPDGQPVESIPMGSKSTESYANFVAAFNNLQEFPGGEEKSTDEEEDDAPKQRTRRVAIGKKR